MSDGNRHHRYALVALLAALTAIVLAAWISSRSGDPADRQVGQPPPPGIQQYQNEDVTRIVAAIRDFDPWEDTFAQWIMAVFAIAATGVSIWAVRLLRDTLQATQEAVRAADDAVVVTREIGQAQVRAYLTIEKATFEADAMSVGITIWVKNVGQSPSQRCRVKPSFRMYDPTKGWREARYVYASKNTPGECGVIGVGGVESIFVLWLWTQVAPNSSTYDLFLSQNVHFDIGCKIEWMDVFDQKQEFYFFLDSSESKIVTAEGARRRSGELKVSSILFGTKDITESREEMDRRAKANQ